MQDSDLLIMIIAALGASVILYLNINKITSKIPANEEENNKNYENFCYFIIDEITLTKNQDENFNAWIDDFIREIKYLISVNKNTKAQIYSQKIAALLIKFDEYLRANNRANLADTLNEKFKAEFSRITKL